ncbi:MAG: sugar porter family MFS transporter [Actinomycetes bacterium]
MSEAAAQPVGEVEVEPAHTGKVVKMAIIAALGGFLFGYDSSVINGANTAVFHQFDITNHQFQGFLVAVALLGSAVGAFIGGQLADRLGRKRIMVIAAILFLIAGVGQGIPFGTIDFMFWRILGGFAIGLAAVISPMYISEVAPAHLRGRLSSLFQLAIVLGIFATQLVNQLLLMAAGGPTEFAPAAPGYQPAVQANNTFWLGLQTWQWMFLCMIVPAVIYGLLAMTLPESPRYLVARGKIEQATKVLQGIFVNDVGPKVQDIKDSIDSDHKPSMSDIKGKALGLQPIVWVGIILAVFQQFVGINAVFYYSNLIWASVGFPASKAFFTSTIISAVNVIFTFVAIAFIDRLGRKKLLMIGSVGMFFTLGLLSILFIAAPKVVAGPGVDSTTVGNPILSSTNGWIAVVSLNVYVAFFAATWGPILWVMLGEMFNNTIRAAAMSVTVATNWIANFIVSESFPTLVGISLGLAYGIFTVCAFASFFYVWKFVKETKGMQLEDMDSLEGTKA